MFPEITRDEVFRIETPRLWLRWPVKADAGALEAIVAQGCADDGARVAHVNGEAIRSLVAKWRGEMEAGLALHLVLAAKAGDRRPVGIIHARAGAAVRWHVAERDEPLATEAENALATMTAFFRMKPATRGNPPMTHQRRFVGRPDPAHCCMQA